MKNNQKAVYQSPIILGAKKSELTTMAANRYMGSQWCCIKTGREI